MSGASTEERNGLAELIRDVRGVVAEEPPADEIADLVADVLAPHLKSSDLLSDADRRSDPEHYQQHVLHVEPDDSFSIVSLVWLPGQRTPIHDHVAWCVVGVYEGDEAEVQYRLEGTGDDRRLVSTGTTKNPQGSTCGFAPPGDVHEVWNAGDSVAISIHVYGADINRLGSSVRRKYDYPVVPSVDR